MYETSFYADIASILRCFLSKSDFCVATSVSGNKKLIVFLKSYLCNYQLVNKTNVSENNIEVLNVCDILWYCRTYLESNWILKANKIGGNCSTKYTVSTL